MQHEPNQWVMLAALAGVIGFMLLVWFLRKRTLEPRDVMPTLDEEEPESFVGATVQFMHLDSGPRAGGRSEVPPSPVPPPAPPAMTRKCPGCDEEFNPPSWNNRFWIDTDFCRTCEPIERSVDSEFAQQLRTERLAFEAAQNAKEQNWVKVGKLTKIRQVREAERDRYKEEQKRIEAKLTKLRAFRGENGP